MNRPTRPPRPAQPSHSARPTSPAQPNESLADEDDGFWARHRTKVIVAAVVLLGAGAFLFPKGGRSTSAPAKAPERMVSIKMPPLPPPPPPPPPKVPPPPKEEKMVQETQPAEEKPKAEAPKPPAPDAPTLGTNLKGDGPGMAGLGGSGNGGGFGGTGTGGGGSKWGWYAGQVQARVAEALRRNSRTKTASMKVTVRIWPDSTGRITRAKLDGTTGDKNLDAVIQNEILTGLQLSEPPPAGMPAPIVMRLTARRP